VSEEADSFKQLIPTARTAFLLVEVLADRPVKLDRAESGPVANAREGDPVTQAGPFLCGIGVSHGLGSRPQLLKAPLLDAKPELVTNALRNTPPPTSRTA